MSISREILSAIRAEARDLRKQADALDKLLAELTGSSITSAVPAENSEATFKLTPTKQRAGKSAKPGKPGRRTRVPLTEVVTIVQNFVFTHPGSTISEIEASDSRLNRIAVTKALKLLGESGIVTDDGAKRNTRFTASEGAPESPEQESDESPAESDEEPESDEEAETVESDEGEEIAPIDPTLDAEPESIGPTINFG